MVGIDIPNKRQENLVHISAQANNHNILLSICQMGEEHNLTTAINSRFKKKFFYCVKEALNQVLLMPSKVTTSLHQLPTKYNILSRCEPSYGV